MKFKISICRQGELFYATAESETKTISTAGLFATKKGARTAIQKRIKLAKEGKL